MYHYPESEPPLISAAPQASQPSVRLHLLSQAIWPADMHVFIMAAAFDVGKYVPVCWREREIEKAGMKVD